MSGPQPQPKAKRRVTIQPEEGGQLEQLLVVNKLAADEAAEAGERAEEYKAGIKSWLLSLFPPRDDGAPNPSMPDAFDIAADPQGRYPGYTMTLKVGHHLDTERMKADGVYDPIYDSYSVPNRASWELRESMQGRRRGR